MGRWNFYNFLAFIKILIKWNLFEWKCKQLGSFSKKKSGYGKKCSNKTSPHRCYTAVSLNNLKFHISNIYKRESVTPSNPLKWIIWKHTNIYSTRIVFLDKETKKRSLPPNQSIRMNCLITFIVHVIIIRLKYQNKTNKAFCSEKWTLIMDIIVSFA